MGILTYDAAGVDYNALDAFKRACQRFAATTTANLSSHQLSEVTESRGDSAYLIETPDEYLAHVEEGLGTKVMVADAVYQQTGRSFYGNIGIDTVATIVNDLVTCGALPIAVAMHLAVGDAAWLSDARRADDLAGGFARGCQLAGAAWGGGETPALRGIVEPETAVLAGSAIGRIRPKSLRIKGDVAAGDCVILLASSGVHTNGLTLCRALAERLPGGYATEMDDGRSFGEALLDASIIYVPFVAACQRAGIGIKYAAHITGHGWRKLMRLAEPLVYEITDIGHPPEVFRFLQKYGPIAPEELYATFNMGAGFAMYVSPADVAATLIAARQCGITAWVGGVARKQGGRKAVEIVPLGITFDGESLNLR